LNYTRTAPGPNQPVARSDMLPDTSISQARIAATTCGHGRPGAAEQRHPPAPSRGHRPGEGGPGSPGAELAEVVELASLGAVQEGMPFGGGVHEDGPARVL